MLQCLVDQLGMVGYGIPPFVDLWMGGVVTVVVVLLLLSTKTSRAGQAGGGSFKKGKKLYAKERICL